MRSQSLTIQRGLRKAIVPVHKNLLTIHADLLKYNNKHTEGEPEEEQEESSYNACQC